MKAIKFSGYFLLGMVLVLACLEAALRFAPVTRGLFRTVQADRWPLHGYTPHARYAYSMAWDFQHFQTGTTNNYGHLAPFDFVKNSRPVIVLGDSFIEAQMLRYADTLQGQLGRLVGTTVPVYGLGFSGNSIAEYLATASMAREEFQPRAAVTLLHDGDISEAIGARALHHYFEFKAGRLEQGYQPSKGVSLARRLREPLGDSALYRYVFGHLKFSPQAIAGALAVEPAPAAGQPDQARRQQERVIVERFLDEFAARAGIPARCVVFLIDADRYELYDANYKPVQAVDSPELTQYFLSRASEAGYQVAELRPRFAAHYRKHGQKFDFWPVDRHWNWLGHKLAAEAAYDALIKMQRCL